MPRHMPRPMLQTQSSPPLPSAVEPLWRQVCGAAELVAPAVQRIDVQPQDAAVAAGGQRDTSGSPRRQVGGDRFVRAVEHVAVADGKTACRVDLEGQPRRQRPELRLIVEVLPSRTTNVWQARCKQAGLTEASIVHWAGVIFWMSAGDA